MHDAQRVCHILLQSITLTWRHSVLALIMRGTLHFRKLQLHLLHHSLKLQALPELEWILPSFPFS